ncbi:MAG: DNA-processing protein DprA [Clostridia bacterium]|nr:DNA-processing protein DprA [Clostridia bacterium]
MELLYEVWLHTICKFEPDVATKIAPLFEQKTQKFTSGDIDRRLLENIGVSGEFAKRISEPEFFKEASDIIDYCNDNGIRIITMESEEYPERLKNINLPPRILFAKGAKLCLDNEVGVSVVGCRKPTDHGKSFARLLGKSMAANNITVISGMAEGIDGQAHLGALDAGGKTIAVLAGSVDHVYPACHEKLYREILQNGGTVLSERPPGTPVQKYFYQQRNRIIIGLSQGTVIVEGKEASGTSITARLALEENNDIFAVPGSPMLWQSGLPNRLISEGAIVVNTSDVPVCYYRDIYPERVLKRESGNQPAGKPEKLITEDERILEFLKDNGGISNIEKIAESLGLSVGVLSGRLTILCIKGKLRQESGNRYVLTE